MNRFDLIDAAKMVASGVVAAAKEISRGRIVAAKIRANSEQRANGLSPLFAQHDMGGEEA